MRKNGRGDLLEGINKKEKKRKRKKSVNYFYQQERLEQSAPPHGSPASPDDRNALSLNHLETVKDAEYFDFEKEIEELMAEEMEYLAHLKASQDNTQPPAVPTKMEFEQSLKVLGPTHTRNASDYPENISDSVLNCDFIQKPRKVRPAHFMEDMSARRQEARERLAAFNPVADRTAEDNYSTVTVRLDFTPTPLPKPDISKLIETMENKLQNNGEGSIQAFTGVRFVHEGKEFACQRVAQLHKYGRSDGGTLG